ncbi:two-partner secretion domain-containing protein [Paraburkholderia youngii]|uniref:two-partner secretion domain-containing protein n=1 Tax=Paraburkholderia youngii TaxID=2782701 RepID=UPI00159120B7|nr:filamentous hemagglutinin N-terminal domain-containing protein [Paraburkholderia youngii]
MSHPEQPRPTRRTPSRRQSSGPVWLSVGISLAGLSLTPVAFAAGSLPQGGRYVAGTGTIAGAGNSLVITQSGSTRGVIDWNSFSIGRSNSVTFNNGGGATLNRVTGGSLSAIFGKLSATGSVYLVNPQGVVVGPSGVVTTGGRFVASTLDTDNCAFMNGGALTLSGNSDAVVVNLGKISSSGGDVFLIARTVINGGTVNAPDGTAEFAAGSKVLLRDSWSGQQVFVQAGSAGNVVDSGTTRAAQISLQAADGNVYALAGGGARIRATGSATRDGHVWLVADDGTVSQRGAIVAKNPDGSGGTVDTEAAQLSFQRGAAVYAGRWNIATPSITVDASVARALQRSLNAGSTVELSTTGANGAAGDLLIASDIDWRGASALTLAAYHNVALSPGATIRDTGSGNLTLRADARSIDNGGSVTNGGTIDWSKSTGTVSALYDMNGTYTPGTLLANTTWTAPSDSGLITQITGYQLVNSLADLENISLDLASNYALGKDIDISTPRCCGTGVYVPIGTGAAPFAGQFDGLGHTISNLNAWQSVPATGDPANPEAASGLFGVVGATGVVRNVSVSGFVSISGYGSFGILAGVNDGQIVRAQTSGSLSLSEPFVSIDAMSGGLVGSNYGTITRSSSDAAMVSEGVLGGLVGYNFSTGVIRQSYESQSPDIPPSFGPGTVNSAAHGLGAGGLVGTNDGLITQSYATGSVTYAPDYCGGGGGGFPCFGTGSAALVQSNTGTIEQSFATGTVTQMVLAGRGPPPFGLALSNTGTIANDVYWDTQTTGATVGVGMGTPVPIANGLTTAQMSVPSSFGPTFDFSSTGVWALPAGAPHPVLRWQLGP